MRDDDTPLIEFVIPRMSDVRHGKVLFNGQDISQSVAGIRIEAHVMEPTRVWIEYLGVSVKVTLSDATVEFAPADAPRLITAPDPD